jgi:hypothetical protein
MVSVLSGGKCMPHGLRFVKVFSLQKRSEKKAGMTGGQDAGKEKRGVPIVR